MYPEDLSIEIYRKGSVYVKAHIGEHIVLVEARKAPLNQTLRKYMADVDIPTSRENGYLVIG